MATPSGSFADLICFSQTVSAKCFCTASELSMKLLLLVVCDTCVIMLSRDT